MLADAKIIYTALDFLFQEVEWAGGKKSGCRPRSYHLQIQLYPMLARPAWAYYVTLLCLSSSDEVGKYLLSSLGLLSGLKEISYVKSVLKIQILTFIAFMIIFCFSYIKHKINLPFLWKHCLMMEANRVRKSQQGIIHFPLITHQAGDPN